MKEESRINDTLKRSWKIFSEHYVALILGSLIALVCMIPIITIPPLVFGVYHMCAQLVKGKKVKASDVFKGFHYFFRSWGIMLLAFLLVVVGLICLVVPGILLMVVLQYVVAVAIMEGAGVIESIRRSFELGRSNFAYSFVLWVILAVIGFVGGYSRIGVLLTAPFSALVLCVAADKLSVKKRR